MVFVEVDEDTMGYKEKRYSAIFAVAEKSNEVSTEKYSFDLAIVTFFYKWTVVAWAQLNSLCIYKITHNWEIHSIIALNPITTSHQVNVA